MIYFDHFWEKNFIFWSTTTKRIKSIKKKVGKECYDDPSELKGKRPPTKKEKKSIPIRNHSEMNTLPFNPQVPQVHSKQIYLCLCCKQPMQLQFRFCPNCGAPTDTLMLAERHQSDYEENESLQLLDAPTFSERTPSVDVMPPIPTHEEPQLYYESEYMRNENCTANMFVNFDAKMEAPSMLLTPGYTFTHVPPVRFKKDVASTIFVWKDANLPQEFNPQNLYIDVIGEETSMIIQMSPEKLRGKKLVSIFPQIFPPHIYEDFGRHLYYLCQMSPSNVSISVRGFDYRQVATGQVMELARNCCVYLDDKKRPSIFFAINIGERFLTEEEYPLLGKTIKPRVELID